MDEYQECTIKKLCCMCLSKDRKLFQLCRIYNGLNNLYLLLSLDSEAYRDGFYKDTANLFICWECKAIMKRLTDFRHQVCVAQKQLTCISDGREDIHRQQSLSKLATYKSIQTDNKPINSIDNFIDCGPNLGMKTENDLDDVPLSQLNLENNIPNNRLIGYSEIFDTLDALDIIDTIDDIDALDDIDTIDHLDTVDNSDDVNSLDNTDDSVNNGSLKKHNEKSRTPTNKTRKTDVLKLRKNKEYTNAKSKDNINKIKKKVIVKLRNNKEVEVITKKEAGRKKLDRVLKNNLDKRVFFKTIAMSEEEMVESREKRRLAASYSDAATQCESCVEGFKSYIDLDRHNNMLHKDKPNHTQCTICLTYIPGTSLQEHLCSHYQKLECQLCDHIAYTDMDMSRHLKAGHHVRGVFVASKKGHRITPRVMNPGSKPRQNKPMTDKRTPFGYKCPECDKYFENKNLRYKHVQRHHREGYKCGTCGKRFPFKDNLTKHVRLHQGSIPREECQICHKMIRVEIMKRHQTIHTERETFSCAECEKRFVCRASYEHHLKYSQTHANIDVLKYKCSTCDKGYRSQGELRDHVNYQHLGKTQHKCPVCGKALATRRCVTRHIKRAHQDIKEGPKDKICQQCGKAFRDKKGLREHEFIHTGERPLSCEICGCTFRQTASLYTHRKRVHKIYPQRKHVQHVEATK